MKLSMEELERKAVEAVRSCLEGVPSIEIQGIDKDRDIGGYRADLVTTVSTPAGPRYFVAEVKSVGQPRAAREAVNRLWRFREKRPDVIPVFIAPYISPASAELCKQDGTSYVDLSGNCRLVFDNSFIERGGRPNPFAEKRDLRSLYSPKSSRVVRVLLANPGKIWKVQELARESEVSLGLAFNVKKLLEDREWIRKTEGGVAIREPEKLLTEWAENYSFRKNRVRDCYSLEPIADLEAGLAEACQDRNARYALTGFSAAARLAPMVRSPHAMAFVEKPLEEMIASLGLKEVTSGANVTLLEPYDAGVFYGAREMGEICLASPVQVYLDLKESRGRGEEAAVKLLDEVIRPRWSMEAGMPKLGVDMPMSAIAAFCGKWKITEFALFGSALRDDFDVASDIDLLVTFAPDVEWSLFDHVRMKAELEELLGRKVDLVNRRALEKSDNWIRRKRILETARVIHAA